MSSFGVRLRPAGGDLWGEWAGAVSAFSVILGMVLLDDYVTRDS